jgi:hypothetical protein
MWHENERYRSESGVLPTLKAVVPGGDLWQLNLTYGDTMVLDMLVDAGDRAGGGG